MRHQVAQRVARRRSGDLGDDRVEASRQLGHVVVHHLRIDRLEFQDEPLIGNPVHHGLDLLRGRATDDPAAKGSRPLEPVVGEKVPQGFRQLFAPRVKGRLQKFVR